MFEASLLKLLERKSMPAKNLNLQKLQNNVKVECTKVKENFQDVTAVKQVPKNSDFTSKAILEQVQLLTIYIRITLKDSHSPHTDSNKMYIDTQIQTWHFS